MFLPRKLFFGTVLEQQRSFAAVGDKCREVFCQREVHSNALPSFAVNGSFEESFVLRCLSLKRREKHEVVD